MLIALMTILFLGGGSADAVLAYIADSKPQIKEVVVDDGRRKAALATLKEMRAQQKAYGKVVKGTVKDLKAVLKADPGAMGDAFWADYFAANRATEEQILELRFKLRDQLTREEWAEVFAVSQD